MGERGLSGIDKLARAAGLLLANLFGGIGGRYSRPEQMTALDWNDLRKDLLRVADIAEDVLMGLPALMEKTMSAALPAIHLQITLASLPFLGRLHDGYNDVPESLDEFMYVAEKQRVIMLHSPVHLTAVFRVLQGIHENHSMSRVVPRIKGSFSGFRN
jgi:hypothetical protein